MQIRYKHQRFQAEAARAIANAFTGQPKSDGLSDHTVDQGKNKGFIALAGFGNKNVVLAREAVCENVRAVQTEQGLKPIDYLQDLQGVGMAFTIEMETGTGKTYTYIKTMYELNERYGWTKFVVVVPSIAIREGVLKSFESMQEHFAREYNGKRMQYFVYNSKQLSKIDAFASDAGMHVMIINTQAFNTSMNEEKSKGARADKAARIIFDKRDEFGSRRPIDVLSQCHPIMIIDEPQSVLGVDKGNKTRKGLAQFKPLFTLLYSATHRKDDIYNMMFRLDAIDAYNQKLVKKIEVKGIKQIGSTATNGYVYLEEIIISKGNPQARISFDVKTATGTKQTSRVVGEGFNLYDHSGELNEYRNNFIVERIDGLEGTVRFVNGTVLHEGDAVGAVNEDYLRRIQIRETIRTHLERERQLFGQKIKVLSLFFIDHVDSYRLYDGPETKGKFAKMFEEEYRNVLSELMPTFDDEVYLRYLSDPRNAAEKVHQGYFSMDKKGKVVESKGKEGENEERAFDLIMKDKERLLSLKEPVRFIFSHSALKEGWDNPNVFQICTLRHANSAIAKRQEVGRGLRICVDQQGNRMDYQELGEDVQEVNKLTVITNESYTDFVDGLQKETKEALRERPTKADIKFFEGKVVTRADGGRQTLNVQDAMMIVGYLLGCGYVDENNNITQRYKEDLKDKTLKPMFPGLQPVEAEVHKLIQSIYDERVELVNMVENGYSTKTSDNALNANFGKKEFQELWKLINHKYVYTVHYDSKELIDHAVCSINSNLFISELKYVMTIGDQNDVDSFGGEQITTKSITTVSTSTVPYDLVGEISKRSTLTRRTAASILRSISPQKLAMFRGNPEEFITKVSRLIKEEKATIIVEHIRYDKLEETYDSDIFTKEKRSQDIGKAYRATKSIQDYVFTDGIADDNNEKKFARSLDQATEVCVYAKLPRGFQIPTPVGNYSPDWAIAFNEGTVKHVFFIAETKGDMSTMELRPIETAKINCARALFNNLSGADVRYDCVKSYDDLLTVMQK